jgi:hypothetical protein
MSQHPPAWFFGETGSAVRSADDGSSSCAHKPFCSPLDRFSTLKRRFNPRTCKQERSGPIGGSVGSTVSLATLVHLLLHLLRSLSMVSLSRLPRPLALMWSWLHKRSDTPLASFFWIPSCLASLYISTNVYLSLISTPLFRSSPSRKCRQSSLCRLAFISLRMSWADRSTRG